MFSWVDFGEYGKKRVKIGEKMSGKAVWLGGGEGEKSGRVRLFSLWAHQNSIFSKWEKIGEKRGNVCVGQNYPSLPINWLFILFFVVFHFFLFAQYVHISFFFFFLFFFFFFGCSSQIFCLSFFSFFGILLEFFLFYK